MNNNYLKEMSMAGYRAENIDDFHKIALPYLGEKFFPEKNSKILDIGAGSGHSIFPFKLAGWKNLWAADIDDYNRDIFEKKAINFQKFNAETDVFPYSDNFFDAILSFHLIEHLSSPSNFLKETRRVLKQGGVFILVTPDWRKQYKTFWRDHTHIHPYDKESIARLLRCYNLTPLEIKSFGVLRGIGRSNLWKFIKPLIFTGINLIAISRK